MTLKATSIYCDPSALTPEALEQLPPNVRTEAKKLHRRRDPHWTSEAKKRFTAQYYRYHIVQGLTLAAMAEKLGRSHQSVKTDVRRYGMLEFFEGVEYLPKSVLQDPRFIPPHILLAMDKQQKKAPEAQDSRTLYRVAQDDAKVKLREHQLILDRLMAALNEEIDRVADGDGDVNKLARLQSAVASQQKVVDNSRDGVLELSLLGERLAI